MLKAAGYKLEVRVMPVACFALLLLFVQGASAQDKGPAPCRDGQLTASRINEDAAMGGARIAAYALTNISRSPCTLEGFPRFEVLSAAGRVVRRGHNNTEAHPEVVTVESGKTAEFSASYNAGGAGRVGKPCPSYPKVRITAPGNRRGLVLREPLQLCGEVEVQPFVPPSGAQP